MYFLVRTTEASVYRGHPRRLDVLGCEERWKFVEESSRLVKHAGRKYAYETVELGMEDVRLRDTDDADDGDGALECLPFREN